MTDALAPPGERERARRSASRARGASTRARSSSSRRRSSASILKNSEYMKGNLLHYWDGLPLSGNAVFPFGPWRDVGWRCRTGPSLRRVSVSTLAWTRRAARTLRSTASGGASDGGRGREVELEIEPRDLQRRGAAAARATATVAPGRAESQLRADARASPRCGGRGTPARRISIGATVDARGRGVETRVRDPAARARRRDARLLAQRAAPLPARRLVPVREHLQRRADRRGAPARRRDAAGRQQQPHRLLHVRREGRALRRMRPRRACSCSRSFRSTSSARCACSIRPIRASRSTGIRARRGREHRQAAARPRVGRAVGRVRRDAQAGAAGCGATTGRLQRRDRGDRAAATTPMRSSTRASATSRRSTSGTAAFPFGEFSDHYDRNHHFISEFGAIAPPVVETLREFMPPEAVWGVAGRARGAARSCRSTPRSTRTAGRSTTPGMCTSVARMFRHVDRDPPTLERFVDAIQWYQAFGLRYCAEVYRRKRFARHRRLPDLVVPRERARDQVHGRRPPAAAEDRLLRAAQQAYEPILLSLDDREPLRPRGAGDRYRARPLARQRHAARRASSTVEVRACSTGAAAQRAAGPAAGRPGPTAGRCSRSSTSSSRTEPGRTCCARGDGDATARRRPSARAWMQVVRPAFDPALRVLVLGQARYNAPILEALARRRGHRADGRRRGEPGAAGLELERGARRARRCRLVRGLGLRRAPVPRARVGQHRRGGARGRRIRAYGRAGVVPRGRRSRSDARLHAARRGPARQLAAARRRVGPRSPSCGPAPDRSPLFAAALDEMPFRGFSRTTARPDTETHWTIGTYPLLVTGPMARAGPSHSPGRSRSRCACSASERASTGRIRST